MANDLLHEYKKNMFMYSETTAVKLLKTLYKHGQKRLILKFLRHDLYKVVLGDKVY